MGSGASRQLLLPCLRPSAAEDGGGGGEERGPAFEPGPLDEDLGHSFCYVRSATTPGHSRTSSLSSAAETAAFKSISGASVSANSSAPLPVFDNAAAAAGPARSRLPGFRSSASFSALPLQLSSSSASRSLDRGFFLSGPIESGAFSGPLDASTTSAALPFSGPLMRRTRRRAAPWGLRKASLLRRSLSERNHPWVVPLRSLPGGRRCDPHGGDDAPPSAGSVQWAHGKAGEDRVHIVVSEEHRWLFVGIYDGFNGPEAPEFLVGNLYRSVFNELRGLFWKDVEEQAPEDAIKEEEYPKATRPLWEFLQEVDEDRGLEFAGSGRFTFSLSKLRNGLGSWRKDGSWIWFPRWRYVSNDKAKVAREVPDRGDRRRRKACPVTDHELVLRALSRALEVTELAYLEMTDRAMDCNPELALMGSCLLVVLMRDDDVYVMNVGDSRAIVAQHRSQGTLCGRRNGGGELDLVEDTVQVVERGIQGSVETEMPGCRAMELGALQLSTDHSTSIEEEVLRIKEEHPDDNKCIVNDRVKGRLKVTRAFGAGFLKQPKWNNVLLEMFRNEYIGSAPYISCLPSLCHHKLGPNDQFLVLSSDGLYQYLSNEEVVLHVESFMERFPDGDPAQSLIEELLSRAAKKAGMDFYELLDIPQGDRRKYHDDVTVMVVSLEGRIWKSSGKYS